MLNQRWLLVSSQQRELGLRGSGLRGSRLRGSGLRGSGLRQYQPEEFREPYARRLRGEPEKLKTVDPAGEGPPRFTLWIRPWVGESTKLSINDRIVITSGSQGGEQWKINFLLGTIGSGAPLVSDLNVGGKVRSIGLVVHTNNKCIQVPSGCNDRIVMSKST